MNILTFDIEEWFHVFENHNDSSIDEWNNFKTRFPFSIDKLLDLLIENDVKATFFCIGWIVRQYPEIIKKISNLGFEIGSHSDLHKIAHQQTILDYTEDLKKSIFTIEDLIGKKVESYRAPGFSINNSNLWVFEQLINYGIKYDCSVYPLKGRFGGFNNFPKNTPFMIELNGKSIKEFPMNSSVLFGKQFVYSGGGFFRLLPYKLIKSLVNKSDYVMTYFHIRDFDPNQPFNDLSLIRRVKSQIGVKGSFKKLENLITDFEFIDLLQADQLIDWEKVPVVKL